MRVAVWTKARMRKVTQSWFKAIQLPIGWNRLQTRLSFVSNVHSLDPCWIFHKMFTFRLLLAHNIKHMRIKYKLKHTWNSHTYYRYYQKRWWCFLFSILLSTRISRRIWMVVSVRQLWIRRVRFILYLRLSIRQKGPSLESLRRILLSRVLLSRQHLLILAWILNLRPNELGQALYHSDTQPSLLYSLIFSDNGSLFESGG